MQAFEIEFYKSLEKSSDFKIIMNFSFSRLFFVLFPQLYLDHLE